MDDATRDALRASLRRREVLGLHARERIVQRLRHTSDVAVDDPADQGRGVVARVLRDGGEGREQVGERAQQQNVEDHRGLLGEWGDRVGLVDYEAQRSIALWFLALGVAFSLGALVYTLIKLMEVLRESNAVW